MTLCTTLRVADSSPSPPIGKPRRGHLLWINSGRRQLAALTLRLSELRRPHSGANAAPGPTRVPFFVPHGPLAVRMGPFVLGWRRAPQPFFWESTFHSGNPRQNTKAPRLIRGTADPPKSLSLASESRGCCGLSAYAHCAGLGGYSEAAEVQFR